MEEKQLNFNRPLLSVRHFTSGAPIENESKRKNNKSFSHLPLPRYKSELKSGPVTNPGTVPFLWEKIPGKPKDDTNILDKPPGKEARIERSRRNEEEEVKSDDEAYVDARDTLSRTESSFLNCSVSGLSGYDDCLGKKSSTDQETRDFMMDRFLPAAKAMVSETPQQAPRKPPRIVQQKPRQLKEFIIGDEKPRLRYGDTFVPDYSKSDEESNEEEEDEIFPDKVCGLLPLLGLKGGSFCLLNPLPGMSVRTRGVSKTLISRNPATSYELKAPLGISEEEELDTSIPVLEKTVYVDTIHKVKEKESKIGTDSIEKNSFLDSSTKDIENFVDKEATQELDFDFHVNMKPFVRKQDLDKGLFITKSTKMPREEIFKTRQTGNEKKMEKYAEFLIPPPLPKSPTDSWLVRTLPTMSAKNGFKAPKYQVSKPQSSGPTWETIVKTTNKQSQHLQSDYQKRLTRISET